MPESRRHPGRQIHSWATAWQIAAVILVAAPSGAAADDDPRLPLPDGAAYKQAVELVKSVFQDEISKAKDVRAKSKLARELLRVAAATEDPSERYVLLRTGREMAAGIGDVAAVLHAVGKLEEGYRVDGTEMRVAALLKCTRAPLPTSERTNLVKEMLKVVNTAADQDKYDACEQLLSAALIAARKATAADLIRTIIARTKQLEDLHEAFKDVQRARVVLKENPEDAKANEAVGRYYCLRKGDWAKGLPYLALAGDRAIGGLATRDLGGSAETAERVKIGDAWWELATADQDAEAQFKQRAVHWYRLALRDLPSGLARLRLTKRVEDMSAADAVATTDQLTPQPDPRDVPKAAQGQIAVHYKCGDQNPGDNQIKPQIKIVNSGRRSVPLGELTVRYWYTREGGKNQRWWCDYARIGNNRVKGSFHRARRATATADTYLEIGFREDAGDIAPGRDSGQIQLRVANTDWSNFDETNDHSFDPALTEFATTPRITLYRDGILIWGAEPSRR